MAVDQIVTGFIYLAVVLVLLVIGKWVYDALHRRFVLRVELLDKGNLAVALAVAGYYVGLAIVLGGVAYGPASFSPARRRHQSGDLRTAGDRAAQSLGLGQRHGGLLEVRQRPRDRRGL